MIKLKGDKTETIVNSRRSNAILTAESALVGVAAGLVTLLYRIGLEYADAWRNAILHGASGRPLMMAGWFAALAFMAFLVSRLLAWESMISGSGIPQVKGEMTGRLRSNWKKVLPAKFFGGFMCLFGGMALGREGPSIQLGAMAGKGVSRMLGKRKTDEKFLLTAGAAAGLSTAFHAPLAGAMFAIEEIHRGFSVTAILSVTTASLTSDCLCTYVLGMKPVFDFNVTGVLPFKYYWMLIILGILLGVFGAFYNWFTLGVQTLYKKSRLNRLSSKGRSAFAKLMIPFMLCGILGFTVPDMLGSGQSMVEAMCRGEFAFSLIILILLVKFVFSAVCFGSGAPGGIFMPMLVLGGFIGGAFADACCLWLGLESQYLVNFVVLAMAGYFTAIVKAPLTGIILIFEMTGSTYHFLSLALVSLIAYIISTLLKTWPIYESLLGRILVDQGVRKPETSVSAAREKILSNIAVLQGGGLAGNRVSSIHWPESCLIVSIQRGEEEVIPRGDTRMLAGDMLIVMSSLQDQGRVIEEIEKMNYVKE